MNICTADQKKRVVLPGISPGERFQVREIDPGRLELVRLVPHRSQESISKSDLEDRWDRFALTPGMSWDDLRKQTREL